MKKIERDTEFFIAKKKTSLTHIKIVYLHFSIYFPTCRTHQKYSFFSNFRKLNR